MNNLKLNGGYAETSINLQNGSITLTSFFTGLPEEIISNYKFGDINGMELITVDKPLLIKIALIYNNEFGIATFYTPILNESVLMQQFVNNSNVYPRNDKHETFITNINDYKISASSSLKEGNKVYKPDNLRRSIIDGPWVEGSPGSGIGEYLLIEFNKDSNVNALLISNGYVSYDKPELFIINNRVKKILIESLDGNLVEEYSLLDTAGLQTIRLDHNISKIKITILDVYKGTDWNDTCINMITGLNL